MNRKLFLGWIISSIVLLLTITLIPTNYSEQFTKEDGIIENFSALCYLVSAICFTYIYFSKKKKLLYLVWAICCFIFFAEEVSWGQRVFNYEIESIQKNNLQNEVNIHNLVFFESPKISKVTSFRDIFLSSQNLFRMAFLSYFLIGPFVMKIFPKINNSLLLDNNFRVAILIIFALSFLSTIITKTQYNIPIAETREFLYSYTILIYCISLLIKKT